MTEIEILEKMVNERKQEIEMLNDCIHLLEKK